MGRTTLKNSAEISLHSISENRTQFSQWKHFSEHCNINIPLPIFCLCTKNSITKVYHIGPTEKWPEFEGSNRFFSSPQLACQYRVLSKLQGTSTLHISRWKTYELGEKPGKCQRIVLSLFASIKKQKKSNKTLHSIQGWYRKGAPL